MGYWADNIINYFGDAIKEIDRQGVVDADGKGEFERYNEIIGEDIDDNIEPLLDNLIENTMLADTMYSRFVPLLEKTIGITMRLTNSEDLRRKVLKFAFRLYQIRGTTLGYEVPLRMLGFESVEIVESWVVSSFDSPLTLDDAVRRLDSGGRCQSCSPYELYLTGSLELTAEIMRAVGEVIEFNEPINARLTALKYNGEDALASLIRFRIYNGDLLYENLSLYDVDFVLNENKELVAQGPDAHRFRIENGNIYLRTI
ncbi:phage tail protein [Bernardetia sp.]|uniref:phage tail protein n=1 Tax=Bernardetia sp. TaxID=1937974 RepID=UPI0025B7B385|nr:phage tail protein [Bernardetia sp.]